jgi:NAD(P)H-hydrate epimerase
MPLTRAAVREIDRRAVEEYGLPGIVLMENAARNAAELFARLNPSRERTAVVCGIGNNGGDGLAMARHLDRLGQTAQIFLIGGDDRLTADARVQLRVVRAMGLPLVVSESAPELSGYGWVIDALFGTGLARPVGPPHDAVIRAMNSSGARILAIDVPSGLDADTGQPLGLAVRAHTTVTFVGMKEGFAFRHAREYVGELHFADIGTPRRLVDEYLKL